MNIDLHKAFLSKCDYYDLDKYIDITWYPSNDEQYIGCYYPITILNFFVKKENLQYYIHKNIILKELIEKVFNPHRLVKICDTYNIEFEELNDIY